MHSIALQSLRHRLASNHRLRRVALPVLRRLDFPISIRNPYAKMRFRLLSYTHKGYWFYGRQREAQTMARFTELICPGDAILEVGGHIGFISQMFSRQTGAEGQVHVFEPGQQNQTFLRKNIKGCANTHHIAAAASDRDGNATFYEENLGGFMNSLDPDFARDSTLAQSQHAALRLTANVIQTVTLDSYCDARDLQPDFIKIDVEGAELTVLDGADCVLRQARAIMVEVTRHKGAVFKRLKAAGFTLSDEAGRPVSGPEDLQGNIFGTRI